MSFPLPPMVKVATEQPYRGFTLRTECMGHTNVIEGEQWAGGYKTVEAAKRRVDSILERRNTTYAIVTLADGRTAYRITTGA